MSGLLIVNADDWGISRGATDAIRACFDARTISSATAMMWMEDSDRAAEIARERSLPIGLHLNLIEPFTAADVPLEVAATQRRVVERLRGGRARHMYHPRWSRDFERCIADQLARFRETYGRAPTHIDGHQHMHLALNALLARSLAPVRRCRRPFSLAADQSTMQRRAVRSALTGIVKLRFATTDWFFSIRALHPALGGSYARDRLDLAARDTVEVMVHPALADEFEVLSAPEWRERVRPYRLGSFADLPAAA